MEADRHTVCETVVCGIVYSTKQNRSNDSGIWSNDVRFSLHENVWFVYAPERKMEREREESAKR